MTAPLDQIGAQNPENRFHTPSSYETIGPSPTSLTNFLISWLRIQCGDANNFRDMILRNATPGPATDYVWRKEGPSGIVIEHAGMWAKAKVEQRPALVVKDGDWDFRPYGIGGNALMGSDSLNPQARFSQTFMGSNTIFCISREPAEAMRLAWEIAVGLYESANEIRNSLCLQRFVLAKFGGIGKIKEATDSYGVPISLAYGGELNWTLRPEAPRFKTFEMQTN